MPSWGPMDRARARWPVSSLAIPIMKLLEEPLSFLLTGDGLIFLRWSHTNAPAPGIFLAFQYPVEVPGVSNELFLQTAFNAVCRSQGIPETDAFDFRQLLTAKLELISMDPSYLDRPVNLDFSGGEKKRNEILQMAVLAPKLAILDETDSGLDVDSLRIVAEGVRKLASPQNATLMITHYQRMLKYITPNVVHILAEGRIIRSGDHHLAEEVENRGYEWVKR